MSAGRGAASTRGRGRRRGAREEARPRGGTAPSGAHLRGLQPAYAAATLSTASGGITSSCPDDIAGAARCSAAASVR